MSISMEAKETNYKFSIDLLYSSKDLLTVNKHN